MNGRAALYHRVSTLDQDPELARAELRAAARARGYEIALEVEETGSGARNDRPGLQRVLAAAARGQLAATIVWKLDRFGRSALDLLANVRALERAGVRFMAVTQGIDVQPGGDPMSRLLLTVLAGVAEFERELISERTRLAAAAAKRRGRAWGRPRAPNRPTPSSVAAMRSSGASWAAIAAELGCTPSAARRALAEIGPQNSNGAPDGERGAG